MGKTKNIYIDNKEFYKEICDWLIKRKNNKDLPLTPALGKKIYNIVIRFSYKPNFINYTYKDKLVSEALYTCCRYAHKFNPEKSKNPFAYFTTIAWSSFIKCINEEKKISNIKKKIYDNIMHENPAQKSNNLNRLRDLDGDDEEWNTLFVTTKRGTMHVFNSKKAYEGYVNRKKARRKGNDINNKK